MSNYYDLPLFPSEFLALTPMDYVPSAKPEEVDKITRQFKRKAEETPDPGSNNNKSQKRENLAHPNEAARSSQQDQQIHAISQGGRVRWSLPPSNKATVETRNELPHSSDPSSQTSDKKPLTSSMNSVEKLKDKGTSRKINPQDYLPCGIPGLPKEMEYEGIFIKGKPFGRVMFKSEGMAIEGMWVEGKLHGRLSIIRCLGKDFKVTYQLEWKHGKLERKGKISFSDRSHYTGEIRDFVPDGEGTLETASGDIYTGTWVNGNLWGNVTIQFKSGDYYEGKWSRAGQPLEGLLQTASGCKFQGCWRLIHIPGRDSQFFFEIIARTSALSPIVTFQPPSDGTPPRLIVLHGN